MKSIFKVHGYIFRVKYSRLKEMTYVHTVLLLLNSLFIYTHERSCTYALLLSGLIWKLNEQTIIKVVNGFYTGSVSICSTDHNTYRTEYIVKKTLWSCFFFQPHSERSKPLINSYRIRYDVCKQQRLWWDCAHAQTHLLPSVFAYTLKITIRRNSHNSPRILEDIKGIRGPQCKLTNKPWCLLCRNLKKNIQTADKFRVISKH